MGAALVFAAMFGWSASRGDRLWATAFLGCAVVCTDWVRVAAGASANLSALGLM